MKFFSSLFVLIILLTGLKQAHAQTPDRKHGIAIRRLFIDYHTPIQGSLAKLDSYTGGWEVAYSRNLGQTFNLVIPAQFGVIHFLDELNNRTMGGADALIQMQFYRGNSFIIPYAMAGVGLRGIQDDGVSFQIPVGVGANVRLGSWAYLTFQGQSRISTTKSRNSLQYGAGLLLMINNFQTKVNPVLDDPTADIDSDGIPDAKDKCPQLAGLLRFDGCPDTDNDGVPDETDRCPEEAGILTNQGCPLPDQDNDGVPDQGDECPNEAGSKLLKGCPDLDGDGIADKDDDCPKLPGELELNGCPVTDRDNDGVKDEEDHCPDTPGEVDGCPDEDQDGVADHIDECPNLAGLAQLNGCPDSDGDGVADGDDRCPDAVGPESNKGCPEIKMEERKILTTAVQAIQFETGSAQLKSSSFGILDEIHALLLRYPEYNLSISGHTDNIGDANDNLTLSESRAEACINYLIYKGEIQPDRLSYIGYGEIRPIADNETQQGRQLNRRVEFDLYIK